MNIIDISEVENDGAFAVFDVTAQDEEKFVSVSVWYSLAEDRILVSAKDLTLAQCKELADDTGVKEEMREAVMAERDARQEETKREERKNAFAKKVELEKTDRGKWSKN